MILHPDYEYVGFRYVIEAPDNTHILATPLPGQHPAAAKDKHRRAAVECFLTSSSPDKQLEGLPGMKEPYTYEEFGRDSDRWY